MDPEALISAGGDVVSSLLNTAGQSYLNRQAFDSTLAADSTQYQRSVADLKAAGLNPMLAYMSSPDPTPNMAAPTFSLPNIGSAYNSARAAQTQSDATQANIPNIQANTQNIQADTLGKLANVGVANSTSAVNAQKLTNMAQDITESVERIKKLKADTHYSSASADVKNAEADLFDTLDPFLKIIRKMITPANVSNSADDFQTKLHNWGTDKLKSNSDPRDIGIGNKLYNLLFGK